mmetsp:Transcript_42620/g.106426  ORF Transcript_42620/g.106426 Transcript_42620/m.106426 type:complete len:110 (+) Transcript_42620:1195-1524(+)
MCRPLPHCLRRPKNSLLARSPQTQTHIWTLHQIDHCLCVRPWLYVQSGDTPTDTPKASGAVASHTGLQVHHHDSHRAEETWQVGSRYLASRLQMMRPREWPHVLTNGSQ